MNKKYVLTGILFGIRICQKKKTFSLITSLKYFSTPFVKIGKSWR